MTETQGILTSPNIYVYHKIRKWNRLSILKNGLKTSIGDSYGHVSRKRNNEAIPAIFVNNTDGHDEGYCKQHDFDIFRINTQIIDNEWFIDEYMEARNSKYLVTFKDIPTHAIELIHCGKFQY